MFVTELDRPVYLVVPTRSFFDKELGLTEGQRDAILKFQDEANRLQLWLREVYHAGDNSFKVQAPPWLVNAVNEPSAKQREQLDTEVASSKTLRLQPKGKVSASSTKSA